MARRPDPSEYAPHYDTYIRLVDDADIAETLAWQMIGGTLDFYRSVSEDQSRGRYAPDKWSVKQVLGHVIDTERVFQFRAMVFSRGDERPLPGMDQNAWMAKCDFDRRSWTSLVEELEIVRASTMVLFRHLPEEALDRRGIASGHSVTVRALGYVIAGHERHHLAILKERYGLREQ
jgi:DinB family protein